MCIMSQGSEWLFELIMKILSSISDEILGGFLGYNEGGTMEVSGIVEVRIF